MVNADRLIALVGEQSSHRVRAYWSSIISWLEKDRRFTRLAALYAGPRLVLLETGTRFHVARKGEDPRFRSGPLRVPAEVLRDRPGDVVPPNEHATMHRGYRWGVLIGPIYRADMFAELETEPSLTLVKLARRTYGSVATAFRVKHDWTVLAAKPWRKLQHGA